MNLPESILDAHSFSILKSRSTVICGWCLITLVIIAAMSMKSGFFNVEFASMCLLILREIIAQVFTHQNKVGNDPLASSPTAAIKSEIL